MLARLALLLFLVLIVSSLPMFSPCAEAAVKKASKKKKIEREKPVPYRNRQATRNVRRQGDRFHASGMHSSASVSRTAGKGGGRARLLANGSARQPGHGTSEWKERNHRYRTAALIDRKQHLQMDEEYLVSEMEPAENEVIHRALGLLGARYRFGGNTTAGIDCSAFVRKVYSALDLPLPRTAREQFTMGRQLPFEELKRGDLLFFHTYADFPSHVGIYVGNGRMIHASSSGGRVMISSIGTPYYRSRYIGARRVSAGENELTELYGETDEQHDAVSAPAR